MVLRYVALEDVQRELGGARVRVEGVMRAEEGAWEEDAVAVGDVRGDDDVIY